MAANVKHLFLHHRTQLHDAPGFPFLTNCIIVSLVKKAGVILNLIDISFLQKAAINLKTRINRMSLTIHIFPVQLAV
jgi:hypothetical protein